MNGFRNGKSLGPILDRAWPGDHRQLVAANRRVPHPHHRLVRTEIEGDQLIRLADPDRFRHAGHVLEPRRIDRARVARNANRGAGRARHNVGTIPELFDHFDDGRDLLLGGARFHYDQHGAIILYRIHSRDDSRSQFFAAAISSKTSWCPASSNRSVTSAPLSRSIAVRRSAFSTGIIGSRVPEQIRTRMPARSGNVAGVSGTIARKRIADLIAPGYKRRTAAEMFAPLE